MFDAEEGAVCWHAPSVHVKNIKFTARILSYFTISERQWTLERESKCDRNNMQGFLLCCKGNIDFYFYRNAFTTVLSILKLLPKSYRILCSLSRLIYFCYLVLVF